MKIFKLRNFSTLKIDKFEFKAGIYLEIQEESKKLAEWLRDLDSSYSLMVGNKLNFIAVYKPKNFESAPIVISFNSADYLTDYEIYRVLVGKEEFFFAIKTESKSRSYYWDGPSPWLNLLDDSTRKLRIEVNIITLDSKDDWRDVNQIEAYYGLAEDFVVSYPKGHDYWENHFFPEKLFHALYE